MSEAMLKTEFGDIRIQEIQHWSWGEKEVRLIADFEDDDMRTPEDEDLVCVVFNSPGIEEVEADDVCQIILHRQLPEFGSQEASEVLRLLQFAAKLAGLIDVATESQRSEAAQKQQEEERLAEEAEAKRLARIEEREEIMLQELVEEKVKVRHSGYKTMCYGEVTTRATNWADDSYEEPTEWKPVIRYTDQGSTRDGGVASYARLDVKTEKGWRTVWDDGKDDLPEYDRNVKLPKVQAWHG